MQVLAYLFLVPLYIPWLLICLGFACFGFFFPSKRGRLDLEEVDRRTTVCKVLSQKGLITQQEYEFETQKVAAYYDEQTFSGYLFIMKPVIYALQMTTYFDSFLLFLVKKWIAVHRFMFYQIEKPKLFYIRLAAVCVALAHGVGVCLHQFKKLSQMRLEF